MQTVKLGDICTIVSGTTPNTNDASLWDGDIKWITPAELNDDSYFINDTERHISQSTGLKIMPKGTVLLSSRAPIGKVAIAQTERCCNQGFKNLICSEHIHNKYLYRFLKGKTKYLNSLGRGATFKEISKNIVENIEIPLPPLIEQHYIASVFDKVASIIIQRKQQLAQLDLLVKSQFVEMFGDITNKAKLGDVCDVRDGTHDSPKYVDSGYPLVTSNNVVKGYLDLSNVNYITENVYLAICKRSKVNIGDIIMPMIGTIGKPLIIDIEPNFAIKNVALIKFSKTDISNIFVHALLSSNFLEEVIERKSKGITQKFLALGDIRNLEIPLPPLAMQNRFAEFAKIADKSKFEIQQGLKKLELQYSALMQQYFG